MTKCYAGLESFRVNAIKLDIQNDSFQVWGTWGIHTTEFIVTPTVFSKLTTVWKIVKGRPGPMKEGEKRETTAFDRHSKS